MKGKKLDCDNTSCILSNTVNVSDENNYAYLFNLNLKFFEKNLIYKLLKTLGLICLVTGVFGYQIDHQILCYIVRYYACVYVYSIYDLSL